MDARYNMPIRLTNSPSEEFEMDQHQFDWVDGRLTSVEKSVTEHSVAIRELVGLVPEIRRLIRMSYVLLGAAAAIGALNHWSTLTALVSAVLTNGIK